MSKIYLKSDDRRVQAAVIVYHNPAMTTFSVNPEDIVDGSSAGPVRCVNSLRVLHDETGPYCYASAEDQAALSSAGLLA